MGSQYADDWVLSGESKDELTVKCGHFVNVWKNALVPTTYHRAP